MIMRKFSTLLILLSVGFLILRDEPDPTPFSTPVSTSAPDFVSERPVVQRTADSQADANCHPSYRPCLRADASDYDCEGGAGNGPYYTGQVRVVGRDVFGLDADGDGWGCDNR